MSAAMTVAAQRADGFAAVAGAAGEDAVVTLRSAGGKPLRFAGALLAEGTSRWPDAPFWHDIQVFARAGGGYAVGLRFRDTPGRDSGADRARFFDTLDDAAGWLEGFDPAADIHAGFDVSDPRLNGAELTLKAAALRDRTEQLRQCFRALVGELLFRLETEI
jgi:hypothetical protein